MGWVCTRGEVGVWGGGMRWVIPSSTRVLPVWLGARGEGSRGEVGVWGRGQGVRGQGVRG